MKRKINYERVMMLLVGLTSIFWTVYITAKSIMDPLYIMSLNHDDKEINGWVAIMAIATIIYLGKAVKRFNQIK